MNIRNLIENIDEQILEAVNELPRVHADKIGLDPRAGSRIYVDTTNDLIIVQDHSIRSLEYYGGFEYVDEEATAMVGSYKVYGVEYDSRVDRAIDHFKCNTDEE